MSSALHGSYSDRIRQPIKVSGTGVSEKVVAKSGQTTEGHSHLLPMPVPNNNVRPRPITNRVAYYIEPNTKELLEEVLKQLDQLGSTSEANEKVSNSRRSNDSSNAIPQGRKIAGQQFSSESVLKKVIEIWTRDFQGMPAEKWRRSAQFFGSTEALRQLDELKGKLKVPSNDIVLQAFVFYIIRDVRGWRDEIVVEAIGKKSKEINEIMIANVQRYEYCQGSPLLSAFFKHFLKSQQLGDDEEEELAYPEFLKSSYFKYLIDLMRLNTKEWAVNLRD